MLHKENREDKTTIYNNTESDTNMTESNNHKGERIIAQRSFFWNAAYSGISAIQSAIILFAVSRTKELNEAGIITMGFALAYLIMIIGGYGIRNYQVTDIAEEYSFSDYFYLRIITSSGAFFVSIIYLTIMLVIGRYSTHKLLVIIEIVLFKLVDTVEGLYVGRLQQKGRLDIGSMIATVRIAVATIVVFVLLWICDNIHICFLSGLIISILLDCLLLPKGQPFANYNVEPIQRNKIKKILISAFPICLGMTLHNYIGNGPKYLVDLFSTDEMQAISGYVMMPMFIITVLNTFLMQPTVKNLGEKWSRKDYTQFNKLIFRHIIIVTSVSVLVMIAGILIGLPVLSMLYNVELSNYKTEFILLMIGGTLYTLSAYLIVLLTTVRKQSSIAVGCVVAVAMYIVLGSFFVKDRGLMGASIIYILANLLMLIYFIMSFVNKINKAKIQMEG